MTASRMRLIQRGVPAPNRAHQQAQSHPWRAPWRSEASQAAYRERPASLLCPGCESSPCACSPDSARLVDEALAPGDRGLR